MKTLVKVLAVVLLSASLAGCAETMTQQKARGSAPSDSGIKGQVLVENEGAAKDVYVYAYDSGFNDLRVPTKNISAPSAADGSYTLNLAPATYYIVARKRTSGDPRGYLVRGDYEGKYPGNPVVVKPGAYTTVNISIAKLTGVFLQAPYLPDEGDTGISGKVYGMDGKPAAGAFVLLYKDKEMIGQPVILSKPTNKDGEYSIYLTEPGEFYVAARIKYGGLPRKGEPYGTYDSVPDHKVMVNRKEIISGVDIKLGPFPFDLAKPTPPAAQ